MLSAIDSLLTAYEQEIEYLLHVAILVGSIVRRMLCCFIDGLGVVSDEKVDVQVRIGEPVMTRRRERSACR